MIAVRELKWTGSNRRLEASALGLDVFYCIEGAPGNWTLISPGRREYLQNPGYQTQAAAKAAAQVDFDQRIRTELREATQERPMPHDGDEADG